MSRENIIPLSSVDQYFDIKIPAPPPHRTRLGIAEATLTKTTQTLRIIHKPLELYFYRNEPKVDISAPDGKTGVSTAEVGAKYQKPPKVHPVTIEGQKIKLHTPHIDSETDTPENTARHLSEKLRHVMGAIPPAIYLTNLFSDEGYSK